MIKDITSLFKKTTSRIFESAIKDGGSILGLKLAQANGLLVANKKLGTQIQNELDSKTGVRGFISTDELPQYGLTTHDKKRILKAFAAAPTDVVIIVAERREKAKQALTIINTHVVTFQKKQKVPKPTKEKIAKPNKKKSIKNSKSKNNRQTKKLLKNKKMN